MGEEEENLGIRLAGQGEESASLPSFHVHGHGTGLLTFRLREGYQNIATKSSAGGIEFKRKSGTGYARNGNCIVSGCKMALTKHARAVSIYEMLLALICFLLPHITRLHIPTQEAPDLRCYRTELLGRRGRRVARRCLQRRQWMPVQTFWAAGRSQETTTMTSFPS